MEDVWFDNFFDDPVLNDRMITDALQPNVQSEHSYSMTNGTTTAQDIIQMAIKSEPVDGGTYPFSGLMHRSLISCLCKERLVWQVNVMFWTPFLFRKSAIQSISIAFTLKEHQ